MKLILLELLNALSIKEGITRHKIVQKKIDIKCLFFFSQKTWNNFIRFKTRKTILYGSKKNYTVQNKEEKKVRYIIV